MEYEVDTLVGDDFCTITAQGDYFVQFCNPPLPTLVADNATLGEYHYDVILMLDTSGSMFGEKINHAIDALKNIINKLPEGDQFNIVRYGNRVRSWRTSFSPADEKNAEKAGEFLDNITVGGSTDIEGALIEAINMAESNTQSGRIPIIMFLTDGGPNVGGNDIQTIVSNISNRAGYGISINGISLGTNDLNGWQLVQRLAAKNRGLSAKYFDIGSFPTEIPNKFVEMREHARSLRGLSDINFKMNGQYVHGLTNTHFADYAEGSDLVVLGKLTDATVEAVPFTLEYTDVEGTKWTEQKLIKVRQVNPSDEEDRFTAGQEDYNPIKQQWAVTAVHQILERRAQAQSEEEYNLLTQEAKSLSYKHQIVSPVVSFLVRKPKSSLNLIDSRLGGEERERRSTPQETHEIRYQYRKLMWRPNQQDGLEAAETVMASLLAQDNEKENDDNNMWLALGSSPLMAFYKLNNYMDSRACLNLPELSGSFKLIQFSDSVVEGTISHGRLEHVSITSADGQLDVSDGKVTLTKGEDSINLEKEDEFNLGPWVAQRSGASLHIINHDQSLSLIVTPIDDRIDIEISGALEHTQGLLEEFAQLDVQLIEKQGKKQVTQTTLLINDQFVPAESVVVDSYDEKSLTTRCWRVEAKQTSKLLH